MRLLPARLLLIAAVVAGSLIPANAAFAAYGDVPSSYWDATAINYVATTNDWMRDYGTSTFKPATVEIRKFLARALVKAFAPSDTTDPTITFTDLPSTDAFYPYANIATKRGWLPKFADGSWQPASNVLIRHVDQALVRALGLDSAVQGLTNIHQAGGSTYTLSVWFPFLQLAHALGLHYNHSDESLDVQQTSPARRDEVAYSLWKAKTLPSWKLASTSKFTDVVLPDLDSTNGTQSNQQQLTLYALKQVGFPYIYAGEWNKVSPSGYCCGSQPQGGFDCSGFTWWVMKKYEDGYNAAQFRTYAGWSIHQRSSSTMAQYTTTKIAFSNLHIGDLMFFSSNGGKTYSDVNHVGLYIGNGWMVHSSSSVDGVVLEWIGTSTSNASSPTYYFTNFVWARRLIGASTKISATLSASGSQLLAGDSR